MFAEHGRDIVRGLAGGITSEGPTAITAISRLAGNLASGNLAGGHGGAGGVLRLEITGGGGNGLDQMFITWLKEKVRVIGGGGPDSVQRALGRTT